MWRPEGWENPIAKDEGTADAMWSGKEYLLYEAGADAMLEAVLSEARLFMDTYDWKRFMERLGRE